MTARFSIYRKDDYISANYSNQDDAAAAPAAACTSCMCVSGSGSGSKAGMLARWWIQSKPSGSRAYSFLHMPPPFSFPRAIRVLFHAPYSRMGVNRSWSYSLRSST